MKMWLEFVFYFFNILEQLSLEKRLILEIYHIILHNIDVKKRFISKKKFPDFFFLSGLICLVAK